MKTHQSKFLLIPAALAAALLFVVSCRPDGTSSKPADVDYYTCTMHPSVHLQDPKAKCPICSMDLIPVMKRGAAGTNQPSPAADHSAHGTNAPGETHETFNVSVQRQQQIGVTFATITNQPYTHTIRAFGTVAYDKLRRWDYVARVEGYVKDLFVTSRGQMVEKDAPLLTLYSPDLLTTQNEFVDVLRSRDEAQAKGTQAAAVLESTGRLLTAAKQRLRLWNISDEQIAELEKSRKPQELLTLRTPFKGVVQELGVEQGRRVMPGDQLVSVADLSVVWVWAQFYQDDLSLLKPGLPVTIKTADGSAESFTGKIALIDPFLSDALRTARVRIEVENPKLQFRPDMYVNVELQLDMGAGPAVPVSAVLPTGQRDVVFVDKGEGRLQPRFVELGRKHGDFYEVKSGLQENERVVTSANFLIDAEAKIQGALKSW